MRKYVPNQRTSFELSHRLRKSFINKDSTLEIAVRPFLLPLEEIIELISERITPAAGWHQT